METTGHDGADEKQTRPGEYQPTNPPNWNWLAPGLAERLRSIREKTAQVYRIKSENHSQFLTFTPHGVDHCKAVEDLLHYLIPGDRHLQLTEGERFFLLSSAWLHDIGMLRGADPADHRGTPEDEIRDNHHTRSERYLVREYREVGVEEPEAAAFGLLARFHRRRCPLRECPEILWVPRHGRVRLRLLAGYLRLADALHIDQTRAPRGQYAIALAYDIPSRSKLHWMRSKFVLGIDIDAETKTITVHLKRPPSVDGNRARQAAVSRMLESIYDVVVDDLQSELDTTKDVLFSAGITYYLRIEKQVHSVEFDDQLLLDIETVFNEYFLLDNPSSSSLFKLLLQSTKGILDSSPVRATERKDDYQNFVRHTLRTFLAEVEGSVVKSRRCHVGLRHLVAGIRREVESPSGDLEELREWVDLELWKLEEKRRAVRYSATRYFARWYEQTRLSMPQAVAAGDDNLAEAHGGPAPSRDGSRRADDPIDILLYGYSELVIKALCGFRDALVSLKIKEYSDSASAAEARDSDVRPWNHERALKKIATESRRKGGTREHTRIPTIHRPSIEQTCSDRFRIFICEGQPKNRTGWGGRVVFHDGLRYALSLAERGFTKLFVVPDAVTSTLLDPPHGGPETPRVQFVMVGANGFDEDAFLHSSGHANVVAVVQAVKQRPSRSERPPLVVLAVCTDKFDYPEAAAPQSNRSSIPTERFNNLEAPTRQRSAVTETTIRDGWLFRNSFGDEPVRSHVFVSQDPRLLEEVRNAGAKIMFYSPREDRIPINDVDVVITERAWLRQGSCSWTGAFIAEAAADSGAPSSEGS